MMCFETVVQYLSAAHIAVCTFEVFEIVGMVQGLHRGGFVISTVTEMSLN